MVKQLLKMGLAPGWGWRLTAPMRHRGVVVLMYHRINAGKEYFPGLPLATFRRQMEWLRVKCTPIWPEEIFDAAQRGQAIRPPVIVTFDDGYRDYYDCAYPVLRGLRIPAVVFLATDHMERGGLIWTDALHWAASMTKKLSVALPWEGERLRPLTSPAERLQFVSECKGHLKTVPNDDRNRWFGAILADLDVSPPELHLGRQMLTWDEVRSAREWTCFGGHSHTHPVLSRMRPADMEQEIRMCRDCIASETGVAPNCFAYPNGQAADFNDTTKDLLRRHGFSIAFSTIEGINGPGADPLALRRIPTGGRSIGDFAALVARA